MVSHHSRGIVTKKDKGKTWGKCRAHINQEEFKAYRGREGKIIASLRGLDYGVEVIMSSVKGLLDKCEDLSSVPRNHAFHRHTGAGSTSLQSLYWGTGDRWIPGALWPAWPTW